MGLSSYPNSQDGLLPMIVVSFVLVAALLKSTARSLLGPSSARPSGQPPSEKTSGSSCQDGWRRVSVVQFGSLCHGGGGGRGGGGRKDAAAAAAEQCCVCLCGFEEEEEVSELRCRHFFHRGCLQQWFDNLRVSKLTCPLCRSLL